MRRVGAIIVSAVLLLAAGPTDAAAHPPGSFAVGCGWTKNSYDDPILYPGEPGGSMHRHAFYGNVSTNYGSTRPSLLKAQTHCTDRRDHSAMWVPTFIFKGVERHAFRIRVYYFPSNFPLTTLPADIQMIGGDVHAMSARANPAVKWSCGGDSPEVSHPYDCRPFTGNNLRRTGVHAIVNMPFCWDGVRTRSTDETHVIFPDPNDPYPYEHPAACPASHPRSIPLVAVRVLLKIQDPCAGRTPCGPYSSDDRVRLRLSSGPYYTMHADFWNAWHQPRVDDLVDSCLRTRTDCGILGVTGRCCPPSTSAVRPSRLTWRRR